jgi:hypothetical protein
MVDPISKAIIESLSVKNEKNVKELVDMYSAQVISTAKNKLKYLSLYYKNVNNDEKTHVINILNKKMNMGMF